MQTRKLKSLVVICLATLTVGVLSAQTTFQTSEMHVFGTSEPVAGAATLTRTADEVWARIATSRLKKKTAYSVWFIVFNEPGMCMVPYACSAADVGAKDPAVRISIFNGGGFVTGTDGTANFTTHVKAGELPDGLFLARELDIGIGIDPDNGLDSEIHIALRRHLGIDVGFVTLQISTTQGGMGTNEQAAVFPAVE